MSYCGCGFRSIFKATYQDRALNIRTELIECDSWIDVVPMAWSYKKAEEKLLTIQYIGTDLPTQV